MVTYNADLKFTIVFLDSEDQSKSDFAATNQYLDLTLASVPGVSTADSLTYTTQPDCST